jgi:septum site-determining protein MinC
MEAVITQGMDLEERALIEAFGEYSHVNVLCVMDRDEKKNEVYIQAANAFSPSGEVENTSVYKGTLHAGQNLETEGSIVVLGDVNPGASVSALGSVVILGTVYGDIAAGIKGDEGTFVAALDIKTEAVSVCGQECTMFSKNAGFLRKLAGAKIIYTGPEGVVCEDITKEFLANIPF